MKNTAELLHVALVSCASAIEKRLQTRFDIHEVQVKVTSDDFWTYEVQCFERPHSFKVANSSESLEQCIQFLEKQLTPRSELANELRRQADALMKQATQVTA